MYFSDTAPTVKKDKLAEEATAMWDKELKRKHGSLDSCCQFFLNAVQTSPIKVTKFIDALRAACEHHEGCDTL